MFNIREPYGDRQIQRSDKTCYRSHCSYEVAAFRVPLTATLVGVTAEMRYTPAFTIAICALLRDVERH